MMERYLLQLLQSALSVPVEWGNFRDGQGLPRVSLTRVGGRRDQHLASNGPMRGSVQIDCWGRDVNDSIPVEKDVRAALEAHLGGPLLNVQLTSIRDGFSNDPAAAARVSLTFALTWRE